MFTDRGNFTYVLDVIVTEMKMIQTNPFCVGAKMLVSILLNVKEGGEGKDHICLEQSVVHTGMTLCHIEFGSVERESGARCRSIPKRPKVLFAPDINRVAIERGGDVDFVTELGLVHDV